MNRLDTLLLATHNPDKVGEMTGFLHPYVNIFRTAGDLNLPEPEETGQTFIENAVLKASLAAKGGNLPAIADDSGMAVTALNGDPGIYSARWAGPGKDFQMAMEKVHTDLGNNEDRSAAFICALALAWPDGTVKTFEGRIGGTIIWPPRGDKGFGYDPMFVPEGQDQTFGEMDPAEKDRISHRAKAFKQLIAEVFNDK